MKYHCSKPIKLQKIASVLWCGYCSVSLQCFLLRHLVIAYVRNSKKLPQKIQNILNEVYRIPQPPSTPEWMISWFTTKLLSFIAFTMSSRLLTSVAKRSFLLGCVFFFCFFVLHTHCHTRHSHLLHNDFKITKQVYVIGCVLL